MTDDLRTRIAAAIYNACDDYTRKLLVHPDCPGASELEGDGKPFCYRVADALIAAEVTMPAPRCPEWVRFGGKRINCQGSVGHEGECW